MNIQITLSLDPTVEQFFRDQLKMIGHKLDNLKTQGEHTMTQLDDMNAKIKAINDGIDNLGTALSKVATDEQKSFADLKAAIAALPGGTPPDLTAQLEAMDSASSKLTALSTVVAGIDADALAADPSIVTPPTA